MSNANFVPMYDLERLDADQKTQYYRDACDFLGIPAHLNLLAFIFMNVGDTGRHEVLYAKKGATDLIRQNKGITTIELVALIGLVAGQVCFMAAGRDKDGREERAVGAASIEGLTGKALSDAIMTAQTRATRRMTLQFVGAGILDESELPDGVTTPLSNVNPEAIRALDAITTQPVVHPNPAPSIVEPPRPAIAPEIIEAGNMLVAGIIRDTQKAVDAALAGPTEAQKTAQAALASVKPEALAKASGETFKDIKSLAAALPADNPLVQAAAPAAEAPKQRKRKTAEDAMPVPPETLAKLTDPALQSPSNPAGLKGVSPSADIPEGQRTPTLYGPATLPPPDCVRPLLPQDLPATALPAQPVEPPKVEKKLKPEEEKEIRARLGKYRNEILPAGKMEPIAGTGGVEVQLRTFVQKFYPEKPSSKTWDYVDWLRLLDYFDDVVKVYGPVELVRIMQQKIGVRA